MISEKKRHIMMISLQDYILIVMVLTKQFIFSLSLLFNNENWKRVENQAIVQELDKSETHQIGQKMLYQEIIYGWPHQFPVIAVISAIMTVQ